MSHDPAEIKKALREAIEDMPPGWGDFTCEIMHCFKGMAYWEQRAGDAKNDLDKSCYRERVSIFQHKAEGMLSAATFLSSSDDISHALELTRDWLFQHTRITKQ